MHDPIADLHLLVFVNECFADVRIMAVLDRRATDQRRPIRNGFVLLGRRQIFTRRKHRRGRSDRADRGHKNMFRRQGDERTG